MTAEFISMVAGVLLSLAFSYIPGLSVKYAALEAIYKRLVMLGLLFLVALGSIGLACAGIGAEVGINITCDRAGVIGVLQAFFLAAMANQSAYSLTKRADKKIFVETPA